MGDPRHTQEATGLGTLTRPPISAQERKVCLAGLKKSPGMRGCGEAQLWSGGQLAAKEGDRMWDGGAHCREDEASRPWLGFWAWSPKPPAGELEEEYITAVVRGPEGDL